MVTGTDAKGIRKNHAAANLAQQGIYEPEASATDWQKPSLTLPARVPTRISLLFGWLAATIELRIRFATANGEKQLYILPPHQKRAVKNGQTVVIAVGGAACVLLRKDIHERGQQLAYGSWTDDEVNLLAGEAADLLAGDALDEPDNS